MLEMRDLSSIGTGCTPSSLREGKEKARVVPSPKTPTKANPCNSNSVTQAASHKKSSQDFDAPFEVAGLNIRTSDWVTMAVS